MSNILNDRTLVVNSGFIYVNIITVKEAIRLIYVGSAEVVDDDYQQYDFERWIERSKASNAEKQLKLINIDHVIPVSRGGKTTWENVVTSCVKCNTRKDNKLPSECNMFPTNQPKKPGSLSIIELIIDRGPIREEWKPFLSYLGI